MDQQAQNNRINDEIALAMGRQQIELIAARVQNAALINELASAKEEKNETA